MKEQSFDVSILGKSYRGHYVQSVETALECLTHLQKKDILFAIDTETAANTPYKNYPYAALSPHLSRIRLIQVFDGKNSIVFDLDEINDNEIFIPFLESKRFVAHNAKFDLKFFLSMGVKKMNMGCSLLLAKTIAQATRPMDMGLSLEALIENVLKIDAEKEQGKSDWSEPELTFEQIEYSAKDPIYVQLIVEKIADSLTKYGLERTYQLYKKCMVPVAKMELNGLGIDAEAHKKNVEAWREELYYLREDVLDYTGLKKLTGHTLGAWLSENLEDEYLESWPRTPTGKLKTDAHTFADFSGVEIAYRYGSYSKKDKLISSFGDGLIEKINPETKRLHASYNISGARTGRMSCSSPNLQQLPRDDSVRNIFVPARKGEVFVSADFSQIELRVAAEISRDQVMLDSYRKGIDLHALTASVIARKKLEQVTKDERQKAKAFNFGLLFGLGSKKFSHYARMAYGVEVTEEEAIASIEIWRNLYAGYRDWQLEQAERCKESLFATTVCGKRQRLTEDNYYGTGLNHPVQGSAAEVMMHALVNFQKTVDHEELPFLLVNCVHDEITVQCRKKEAEYCRKILENAMTRGYTDVFPKGIVNKLVEAKIGNSWGAVK